MSGDAKKYNDNGSLLHMVPGPTSVPLPVREAYLVDRPSSDTERVEFAKHYRHVQVSVGINFV